jgi:acetolactate synthase-like protein
VVDTRHEATAVFAADASARLSGTPGVAVVTAGPGVTNTVTAVVNARLAQSPVVLLGGAAATMLRGRGALQDIDQLALLRPTVKWSASVRRLRELAPAVETAFRRAREGVPGPVFVECPIDLLYDEALVRDWYASAARGRSLRVRLTRAYLDWHLRRLFAGAGQARTAAPVEVAAPEPPVRAIEALAARLREAERPVMVVGSQAVVAATAAGAVAEAVEALGVPVYLSGMARGLLGRGHPLQLRHRRRQALREADLVILAGLPTDFRLDYGNHIPRSAVYVSLNRSAADLRRNRRPDVAVPGDAGRAIRRLAATARDAHRWAGWLAELRGRDADRDAEIGEMGAAEGTPVDPVHLCREIAAAVPPEAVLVGDGGDFVATASYVVEPPGPLSWLDPGAFGTLGVGAGFAIAAKLCRPDSEVWLLWGDGAAGFSLAEFDTMARHGLAVIAVVGNDGAWAQIAREQVEILGDDVGTVLARNDYHRVAEGWVGRGLLVRDAAEVPAALAEARRIAGEGAPVLVNVQLGRSDFRKGSLSM